MENTMNKTQKKVPFILIFALSLTTIYALFDSFKYEPLKHHREAKQMDFLKEKLETTLIRMKEINGSEIIMDYNEKDSSYSVIVNLEISQALSSNNLAYIKKVIKSAIKNIDENNIIITIVNEEAESFF